MSWIDPYFEDTFLKDFFMKFVKLARDDPADFLKSVFFCLTPFMIISVLLRFLKILRGNIVVLKN